MRDAMAGADASDLHKAKWKRLLTAALLKKRKRAIADGDDDTPALKQMKIDRSATWEWLCALDDSMAETIGHGLEWYACHKKMTFNEDFEEDEKDLDNVLVFCMDEEQKQLCGYYYLERALQLNVVRHQPPFHRRHNDLMNTLTRAGLYDVVHLTIMQRNIAYGPWGKGGNLQDLWDSALEMMAVLTEDDSFLMFMWPTICRCKGWASEADTGRKARQAFARDLRHFRIPARVAIARNMHQRKM